MRQLGSSAFDMNLTSSQASARLQTDHPQGIGSGTKVLDR